MKGIILAGGTGSRLYPMTLVASKQLQPVYDKPMVYYALTTLLEAGIRDIALISTAHDLPRFRQLLGDGERFGIKFTYLEQPKPEGIAQAFLIAAEFLAGEPATLILGDNIFYGTNRLSDSVKNFTGGAVNFGYCVNDPQRYGVVVFDPAGRVVDLVEKPQNYISPYALPGFYIYDGDVVARARQLKPSKRGELEITDLSRSYLAEGKLAVPLLPRGVAWLDAGTSSSLHEASAYIQTIEKRQGIKVGCPEEAALRGQLITRAQFEKIVAAMPYCEYRSYLEGVVDRPY